MANSQIRGEGDSEEGGVDRTGNLRRDYNRARCHDAIHSYLIEIADFSQAECLPTFHKAISAVEALANQLASRTQAGQD